jgi:hypothetical protein
MCNKKIGIIRENFEKYFDADWLASIIKNYGYDNFECGHKVAIDLETNEVWCMQNNEYSQDSNGKYFALPEYIMDYEYYLDKEIKEGNFSKNKTLKGYIKDNFSFSCHFCINYNTGVFYLKDELLIIEEEEN